MSFPPKENFLDETLRHIHHHFLLGTSPFSSLVYRPSHPSICHLQYCGVRRAGYEATHLVHGMLWHWLDLQWGWLCICYFYIPNVSGVDLRTERSRVWSVLGRTIRVFPLGYPPPILTLLWGVKQYKPRLLTSTN